MARKSATRALAANDNVLGACVITDKQTGAQTTRCGTKDQCDNWGGVFMGPPCGLDLEAKVAAPAIDLTKTVQKKAVPVKGTARTAKKRTVPVKAATKAAKKQDSRVKAAVSKTKKGTAPKRGTRKKCIAEARPVPGRPPPFTIHCFELPSRSQREARPVPLSAAPSEP